LRLRLAMPVVAVWAFLLVLFTVVYPALDLGKSPRPIAEAAAALTPEGGSIGLVGDVQMAGDSSTTGTATSRRSTTRRASSASRPGPRDRDREETRARGRGDAGRRAVPRARRSRAVLVVTPRSGIERRRAP
jgi:hypothetical protein